MCQQPPSFCLSAYVFLFRDLSPGFEPYALKVDCLLWFLQCFLLIAVVSAYLFAFGLLSHEAWACSCSVWVHLFPVGFIWPALYRKASSQADPSEKWYYLDDYLLHQVMIGFDRLHNFEAFSTQFLLKHSIVPTHLFRILILCKASSSSYLLLLLCSFPRSSKKIQLGYDHCYKLVSALNLRSIAQEWFQVANFLNLLFWIQKAFIPIVNLLHLHPRSTKELLNCFSLILHH